MTGSSGAVTAYGQEETSEGEWKRISLTFTLPSNASSASVTVRLHAAGSAGTVWFDGAQLEEGVTAGRLNLIQTRFPPSHHYLSCALHYLPLFVFIFTDFHRSPAIPQPAFSPHRIFACEKNRQ